MATPPFNINEALPGDNDIVSQHPANARTFRDVIEDWISVEHDTYGRHTIGRGTTAARDAITTWEVGALWINTDNTPNELEFTVSIDPDVWVTLGSVTLLDTLVTGPGTVTDERIVLFDGTTGYLVKQASEGILATIGQAEAEAGTATTRRIFTAERVKQAIVALESGATGIPDVILEDQKSSGTDGGTATSGSWETRDLNTEVRDNGSICTLSGNQFTLAAGTYYIRASAPAIAVNGHQARLYDVTGTASVAVGTSEEASSGAGISSRSEVGAVVTIASPNIYRLEHQVTSTRATEGHGRNVGFGTEVYSRVEIWKL